MYALTYNFLKNTWWQWLVVLSLPISRKANASYVDQLQPYYLDLIVLGSLVFLVLGTLGGAVMPQAENEKPLPIYVKVIVSLIAGLSAFVYVVDSEKQLTMMCMLWVGGVSFVGPLIFQLSLPIAMLLIPKVVTRWINRVFGLGNDLNTGDKS